MVYFPVVRGDFVWDDRPLIADRAGLFEQEGSWRIMIENVLWWGTVSAGVREDVYRPWISFMYWAEYQIGGLQPFFYHFVNYTLHLANSVFVLFLFLPLLGLWPAAICAAMFGVAPGAISSVGWISGSTDVWALFFSLIFLLMFRAAHQKGNIGWGLGATLSWFLALCSKEVAVVAPLLALLLMWVSDRKVVRPVSAAKKFFFWVMLLLPLVVYFVMRQAAQDKMGIEFAPSLMFQMFSARIPMQAEQYLRTAFNLVVPLHYDFFIETLWTETSRGVLFFALWLVFLALVGLVIWGLIKRQTWAAGGLWFGIALLPSYSSGQSFAAIAEFYAYSALPGLWLFVTSGGLALFRRMYPDRVLPKAWTISGLGILLLLYGGLTLARQPILWSDYNLGKHMVERDPRSVRALYMLSSPYQEAGDTTTTIRLLKQALEIEPDNAPMNDRLASLYMGYGMWDHARPYVERMKIEGQSSYPAQTCVAKYYLETGRADSALLYYRTAYTLHTPTPDVVFDVGRALIDVRQYRAAIEAFSDVLKNWPTSAASYHNIGWCLENLGENEQAKAAYREALQCDPQQFKSLECLIKLYVRIGDLNGAKNAAAGFNLSPEQIQYLNGLIAAARTGDR